MRKEKDQNFSDKKCEKTEKKTILFNKYYQNINFSHHWFEWKFSKLISKIEVQQNWSWQFNELSMMERLTDWLTDCKSFDMPKGE